MKSLHIAMVCAAAIAAPAQAAVIVNSELALAQGMIVTSDGQRVQQTIAFAPITIRPGETFEFNLVFTGGAALSMIDDPDYPAVRSEIIFADLEFADNISRTINYSMRLDDVRGDFLDGITGQTFATRSSGPNLSTPFPFNLTNSNFSFSGVHWAGTLSGGSAAVTISSYVFDVAADQLQVVQNPTAAVPEPATWAMLVSGFGGVGMLVRRRRSPKIRAA